MVADDKAKTEAFANFLLAFISKRLLNAFRTTCKNLPATIAWLKFCLIYK